MEGRDFKDDGCGYTNSKDVFINNNHCCPECGSSIYIDDIDDSDDFHSIDDILIQDDPKKEDNEELPVLVVIGAGFFFFLLSGMVKGCMFVNITGKPNEFFDTPNLLGFIVGIILGIPLTLLLGFIFISGIIYKFKNLFKSSSSAK